MLARCSVLTLFTFASPLFAQGYGGKFADHPNFEKVKAIATSVAENAPKDLPKWVVKKPPTFTVQFVDAKEPLGEFVWPGKFEATCTTEMGSKSWSATIKLPLDSIIRDTTLVEPALRRQIFGIAAMQAEFASGINLMEIGEQGLTNPVIDAIAAHWAGSLDREIDYGLRRKLEDIDATLGLVTDLEVSKNGAKLEERPEGDLSLLMLMSVLAPKNDKKLAKLFESIMRKQPLKQGLEKAMGKKMDRLNGALHKALEKRLKDRFTKRNRAAYKAMVEAMGKQEWSEVMERSKELLKPDLCAPNVGVIVAIAADALEAEAEMSPDERSGHKLLLLSSMDLGQTPFAAQAQARLAESLMEMEAHDPARKAWEALRDEFAWQGTMTALATEMLDELGE